MLERDLEARRDVIIGHPSSDNIRLSVFGYMYPDSEDSDDGNWLISELEITSGAFKGIVGYDLLLRSGEFERFLKDIEPMYETLTGTAKYTTMEDWLEINVEGDGRGHIAATGFVIDRHINSNKLNFHINFDQTSLPQMIKGLKKLLEKYPPRDKKRWFGF
jgi:hypothetical protein